MFKALARLASSLGAPRNPAPQDDAGPGGMPIVVSQSAFDAYPDDSYPLVANLIDYVNTLTHRGRYNRAEIPPRAMQAFHMDYYLAQVNNGGHAQFVHNCGANMGVTLADIRAGMDAADAGDHLLLVDALDVWLETYPDEAAKQTGFEGGIAPVMKNLDHMFYGLEADGSLGEMIAGLIADAPELLVVPDHELESARQRLCAANPHLAERERIFTVAGLNAQMTDPFQAALSLAAGRVQPVAPILKIGNGAYQEVEGCQQMCFFVQTTAGNRWAVMRDDGLALHERIDHKNPDMPENPLEASMEQISDWKSPEVGAKLSYVAHTDVEPAVALAQRLRAGAAIDLLLSRLVEPPHVDRITVRSAGPDAEGELGLSLLLVLNNGTQAMSAVVTETAAKLLLEPSHHEAVKVARVHIDAHADRYALDRLLQS